MPRWEALTYELPADEEEVLSLELWALGACGIEILPASGAASARQRIRLIAYFDSRPGSGLESDPPGWAGRRIRRVGCRSIEARDWLAAYRAAARPFDVGPRLRIDPGDPPRQPDGSIDRRADRILLRIPARRAFGTGSHESTRLLLEWLQELELGDLRIADIGAGSGILALAAAALGAERPVAVDIDPVAIFVARETARANGVDLSLVVGRADCLAAESFDLVLLNILPSRWLADLEAVGRCLARGGEALVSGASREDVGRFRETLDAAGWRLGEERSDGEWRAVAVEAPPRHRSPEATL